MLGYGFFCGKLKILLAIFRQALALPPTATMFSLSDFIKTIMVKIYVYFM